jgi:hypothetical protein
VVVRRWQADVNKWTAMKQVPATSAESDALSRPEEARVQVRGLDDHLRAHAATGMVNDHRWNWARRMLKAR